MQVSKTALVLSIAIIITAFQAAPGPFVLCHSRCTIPGTGEVIDVTCFGGPSVGGTMGCVSSSESLCPSEELPATEATGCCMIDEGSVLADACSACDQSERCPSNESKCPLGFEDCWICLPNRFLAEPIPASFQFNEANHSQISPKLTIRLQIDDALRRSTHSHSPAEPILAESGMDICVRVCSFLI